MPDIDLTPAEALVLLDPDLKQGRNAFKLSMMWLIAQRHLVAGSITPSRWFGRPKTWLGPGSREGRPLPDDLTAVMRVVRESRTGLMKDIVRAATHRFGVNLYLYQTRILWPALLDRGLLHVVRERKFLIFTRKRFHRTPNGQALARRIEGLCEDARRIPEYLDRSPAQAAALAASLGGLILLVPELRPHLTEIAVSMRQHPFAGSRGGGDAATSSNGSGGSGQGQSADLWRSETEAPNVLDFDFDFPDFDLADFATIEASFDGAGGAGGGDGSDGGGGGGGGDGGGG